ncbi:MAG: AraC family transcriptional regulator [Lachnospiraceae bacterium]|nr:AraC family transcriptional regulator [Lachnospiraceae bacterium]
MQYKTSSKQFLKYGSVYEQPMDISEPDMLGREWNAVAKTTITQLLRFNCEVYIEMQSGMAVILVGETPETSRLEAFAVHRYVRINPEICFTLIAVTPGISYKLIVASKYTVTTELLDTPYIYNHVLPRVRVQEILGYYYNIRTAGYSFHGERHNYFELTYVDRGCLQTEIDGVEYELKEKDLIIYGPGQFHTQSIRDGESSSYATIIFDMNTEQLQAGNVRYEKLLNRVFHYDKKIYTLIKNFVQESNSDAPYMNSLVLCLLSETIIRLLQSEFVSKPEEKPVTGIRQHYQDELFERIVTHINNNICEPLTIAEICQKFSLSRSSLQILFKDMLDQTPKRYISDLKLERGCQMIRENKYTISEIALMLGFNSIHYFSRAFTQKYRISPSEYAKQMLDS